MRGTENLSEDYVEASCAIIYVSVSVIGAEC